MRLEAVPQSALGDDVPRLAGIFLDLFPQMVDIYLQIVCLVKVLPPPYLGQQALVGQDAAQVIQEAIQDTKLGRG